MAAAPEHGAPRMRVHLPDPDTLEVGHAARKPSAALLAKFRRAPSPHEAA